MRVGLFFGSFNPPHIGHTAIAEFMLTAMQADEIWMVVSPQNPFKESKELLPEEDRFRLVKRAIDGDADLKPCNFEFDLPKPSYTVDTMRAMSVKHPDETFFIIMGSDNFQGIKGWKDYEELLSKYPIAVYPRPGYDVDQDFIDALPGEIVLTDAPSLDISSTEIRRRIKEGGRSRFLMRESVARAVERLGYYRSEPDTETK